MQRKFSFIILIIITISSWARSQDVRQPPRVVGPSPEASSLGQYGSWPVSLYTGIPQIEAPLYTIDYSGFNLPIGLSYHASGIRVEDVASWVGTGWALQATGVVTRTVMGIEDESPNGYYKIPLKNKNLPDVFDVYGNESHYKLFTDITSNFYDTEPDMFYFNFGGVSGQFFFDASGTVKTIPASTLKVTHHPLDNNQDPASAYWEIVDDKGITYVLGQDNAVESTNSMDDDQMYHKTSKTAWYLNKIVLPNKQDSVMFQYTSRLERYATKPSQTYRVPERNNAIAVGMDELLANGYGLSKQTGEGPYSALNIITGNVQLNAINWKYGKVNFYATTARKDIAGLLLDSVRISDNNGRLIKNFQFRYNNNVNRPFLLSIIERDKITRDTLERYRFEYYNGLPSRFSNSQDYWGYYNGESNTDLVPYDPRMTNFATNLFAIPSAKRSCSDYYMKAGTLSKIYYPTRGYTIFDFEPNRYYNVGEFGPRPDAGTQIPGYYTTGNIVQDVRQENPIPDSTDIDISNQSAEQNTNIKIQIRNYYKGPGEEESYLPRVTIGSMNADGSMTVRYRINAFDDWERATTRIKYNNNREDLTFDLQVALGSGKFKVITELACLKHSGICPTLEYNTVINTSVTFGMYVPPTDPTVPGSNLNLAGGLRIKAINTYDAGDKLASRKQYDYTTTVNNGTSTVSSGTLLVMPKFYAFTIQNYLCSRNASGYCNGEQLWIGSFSSTSLATLGLTQGGYVGYEEVREREDVNGQNGETIYKYSMAKNDFEEPILDQIYRTNSRGWPVYMPNTDNGYKRGLLLQKKVYVRNGADSTVVRQEDYNYNLNDYEGAPGYSASRYLKVRRMTDSLHDCCSGLPPAEMRKDFRRKEFAYSFYTVKSTWVQLISKTVLQDGVKSTIKYEYNNPGNMLATKEISYTSAGDSIITLSRYPQDIINAGRDYTGVYRKMVDKNIITPVVEEETVKNASVSKSRTSYKNWPNNGNLFLPDSVLVSYSNTAPYYPVLIYNSYDLRGNPLSYSANNTPVNFLWGYNKQYPVVKVTGSNYNKIAAVVNNTLLDQPSNDLQVHGEAGKIRNGITDEKILVQSYAYSPLVGITSETNAQGKSIYYEYDGFGRLHVIRDHDNKVLKVYTYKYGSGDLTYYNDAAEDTFIRKTCVDGGYTGAAVRYVVPGGTYSSTVSQSDANLKAFEDVRLNGQLYADVNGACNRIYYNTEQTVIRNRNNCTGDGEGSPVSYIVPARKFSSTVSQQVADSFATDDVSKYAQPLANQNGFCVYYNDAMTQAFTKTCTNGTGSPVSYTVPARKYSRSSKAEAQAAAQAEINSNGQNKANAEGFCTYYNSLRSQTFNPACTNGFKSAGSYTYTVPANRYSSTISKADADQKAQNDINSNGQATANTLNCVCQGQEFKVVNGRCETGSKVQIESHREGDKWACTYYYRFSDGSRSATYSGLGEQQCMAPINE